MRGRVCSRVWPYLMHFIDLRDVENLGRGLHSCTFQLSLSHF